MAEIEFERRGGLRCRCSIYHGSEVDELELVKCARLSVQVERSRTLKAWSLKYTVVAKQYWVESILILDNNRDITTPTGDGK